MATKEELENKAKDFVLGNLPYSFLNDYTSTLSIDECRMLDDICTELCQRAVCVAKYAYTRSNGGTHTKAVQIMNKYRHQIRKVLGFTYPKDDVRI